MPMRNSIRLSCGTSVFCSATPRWTSSVFLSDFGIEKRLSESFQLRQRAFFVDPY
jgi:hypothetical protein